jgi:signal transduction histidine kinase
LVNIVEDMLFLERRKSGDSVTSTNLSNLLQDVLEDLQPSINSKKLKLKTKINEDITMTIDPQDFIKLSRNLIENAIKYSKNNQTVNVGLVRNGRISLTVKDRGIGIPAEELSNIGERFYRAKNVSKTPGTGLGIAIVMKVLNAYGGKLKIESTFNKGTEVTVTL